LPKIEHDGDRVLSYKEAMALSDRPRRLVVIGAGAIGIEFAYFYAALGTKVIVLEVMEHILPVEDEEVARSLARSLAKMGIEIHAGVSVEKLERGSGGVKVTAVPKGADAGAQRIE